MQRASKTFRRLLTTGILLAMILNTVPVFAAVYEPVTVQIPVEYQDKKDSTGLYVTISSEDPNAPLPNHSQLFLTDGEKENFEIAVSEPGTYTYEINYTVDDTATDPADVTYIVNLYAIAKEENLKVNIAMGKKGKSSKSEECLFLNVKRGGHPDLDENSDSDKTKITNNNQDSPKTNASNKPRTGNSRKGSNTSIVSVKTGDPSQIKFYGILMAMSLLMVLFLFSRQNKKKRERI